jgi:hypothetical protein
MHIRSDSMNPRDTRGTPTSSFTAYFSNFLDQIILRSVPIEIPHLAEHFHVPNSRMRPMQCVSPIASLELLDWLVQDPGVPKLNRLVSVALCKMW